ncbi:MAG: hypothetical protein HY651_02115 [Acidobacteria bacterium]|nr:hypothetical protein [Acidobacteriota bacterium]
MLVDQIERFAILEGLTPEESDAVLRGCALTRVRKGENIFEAGKNA